MLYIIYSKRSLEDIHSFLLSYGTLDQIGPARIMYYRGKETDRTVILLSPEVYDKLVEDGYGHRNRDLYIVPYQLRDYDRPKNGERSLFFSLPKDKKGSECRAYIGYALAIATSLGAIPKDGYKLSIPLYTRTSDVHKGLGFLHFDTEVPIDNICYLKAFLHGYEGIRCFWSTKDK
jgi:hypothetical protein